MSQVGPQTNIGMHETDLKAMLSKIDALDIVGRIWWRDYTVWKPDPSEIANRLGWLTVTDFMRRQVDALKSFALDAQNAGFRHVVLLGMGGSSLGAAVLGHTFSNGNSYPELIVMDSTLPESIQATLDSIKPRLTLFLVSSKSGTTTEPLILYAFFRNLVEKEVAKEKVGQHFVAISDAGTPLATLAQQDKFRHIFLNPADIGGRYSVLSYFGLVPAALIGINVTKLLDRSERMRQDCSANMPAYQNPGAWLGACLGALALNGCDKLTLITSPSIATHELWIEQLIAESTGKEGKGIVPISGEPIMEPDRYGHDRLFVYIRVEGDRNYAADAAVSRLISSGQPAVVLQLQDRYDIGAEFFRWQFATAVASAILRVQPFDQPDVQKAKAATAKLLQEFSASGHLKRLETTGSAADLLAHADKGRYLAIMAYLHQTSETDRALAKFRRKVAERYKIATTLGYGPRYLHSTGQLYKGGKDTGLFLQLTVNHEKDLLVPGKPYTFGTVADAQALGDFQALQGAGRMVVRVDLPESKTSVFERLLQFQ